LPKYTYTYKALNRVLGKAIHHYNMISDNDRIAVGLSGGKDSLTLMWFLNERLRRVPVDYMIFPIYIDPGFESGYADSLFRHCQEMGYTLTVDYTDHGIVAHSLENRENPCFLCAKLRRKRIFEIAHRLGCNKVALAHNKDDLIETLFLNMIYAGEISTMKPAQSFFKGEFYLIRPFCFADENLIRKFALQQRFPEFKNPCPTAKVSKRKEIKNLLNNLYISNKKIKGNIFRAMQHIKQDYLL
jgi:tRNA 2-thiocytidine biosynthesis protein TtcA